MNNSYAEKKALAKESLEFYLEEMHGIDTRRNFNCLNPDHADYHPSMAFDRRNNRCVCFSCGARYDIFDVVGLDYQLTSPRDQFRKTFQILDLK